MAEDLKPAPAIGYSVNAVLGDRRNMTIQCFVGEDETDEQVNAKIDRIMRVVDRQQATYDIEAELEGFHKVGTALRQLLDGLDVAERNYRANRDRLASELSDKEKSRKETFDAAYQEWVASGRSGEYRPKGHVAQKLAIHDSDIGATRAKLNAMPNDKAQHMQELTKSILHYQDDLKKRRTKVNYLRGQLGKAPIGDYSEEEGYKIEA